MRLSAAATIALLVLSMLSFHPRPLSAQVETMCSGCLGGVEVTPDSGVENRSANTGPWTVQFDVLNTSATQKNFSFQCSATGGISCVSVVPSSKTLNPDQSWTVQVTYNVGSVNGQVALTATATGASDDGYYVVNVLKAPAISLRRHNGDNRDRSLCLTSGAGESAAWQCGDLVIVHGLPAYSTMGRERSLSLLYNSSQAIPRPIVAAAVDQVDIGQPTGVFVRLLFGGVVKDSATYDGWGPLNPTARQIVIAHDASNDSTGLYPFTLSVKNQYSSGSYETTVSDTLIVINRMSSRFGRGWSLIGLDELRLSQPGNKILWVGGDGSAKVYRKLTDSTWLAAAGAFRDTLWKFDSAGVSWYRRWLRHGVAVTFDVTGRHRITTNRTLQSTFFYWSDSPSRLDSIKTPPSGVAGTTYRIAYNAADSMLDKITDPTGRVLDATTSGGRLTSLVDPDTQTTSFSYDGSGRLLSRTNRRGFTTRYVYVSGLRVDTVKVPLNASSGDTARTIFRPWDEQGFAATQGATGLTAVDTAAVYTKIDGPRTSVGDTAEFWIDRWGAPVSSKNPLGAVTVVVRGDGNVPALVTQVTTADGRITKMSWNTRANLTQVRDSTSHLTNGQPTAVTRWTYTSDSTKDAPDSIVDPEGLISRYLYNAWGLVKDATAPNGHVTHFDYVTSGSLKGLVQSVVERSVQTFDSTSATESVQDLTTSFAFNALGNDTSTTTPMGRLTRFGRDSTQRVTSVWDPLGHQTEYNYDALNRSIRTLQHVDSAENGYGGPLVSRRHFAIDVMDSVVDPRSVIVRRWAYDAAGRVTLEIDDYNDSTKTYYNAAGLVDSIRPRFAASQPIRFSYDAAGNVAKKVWPARDSVSTDSVLYTYDSMGRLLTATTAARKITRTYYPTGLLRTEVQSNADGTAPTSHQYAYDLNGRRVWYRIGAAGSLTYSDSIWYRYTSVTGDLSVIGVRWRNSGGTDSVRFKWDTLGRRDSVRYTMGAVVKFAYDGDGATRVICSSHSGAATPDVFSFTDWKFWVNADGLTRQTATTGTYSSQTALGGGCGSNSSFALNQANAYDSRHQLKTQFASGFTNAYTYDSSGNVIRSRRYTDSLTFLDDRHYATTGHNRLDSLRSVINAGHGKNYVFTADGARRDEVDFYGGSEQPNGTGRRLYYYDALERLTGFGGYKCQLDSDGNCYQYIQFVTTYHACKYDPIGRSHDPCDNEGNSLGFDGENVVRTNYDSALSAWTFVQGPGLDDPLMGYRASNSLKMYWITDGNGRQYAAGLSDGSDCTEPSDPVCGLDYGSHGGNYAGGVKNSSTFEATRNPNAFMPGLSFFRNRLYDKSTGRWTQEDPIGVAGGANLYQFNGNNPVAYTDAFGLCTKADGRKDCERMISRAQGMQIVKAAKSSGEWTYSQGNPGEGGAIDYSARVGDCTDYCRNAVQVLGSVWLGGAKANTAAFRSGLAAGFTEVEQAAAQPGDIVVQGGHAGVFTGINSRGEIRALANNGCPVRCEGGYRDSRTTVTTFTESKFGEGPVHFYRALRNQ